MQCKGTTQEGKPCRRKAVVGSLYCRAHSTQAPPVQETKPAKIEEPIPEKVYLYPTISAIKELDMAIEDAQGEITPQIEGLLRELFEDFTHGAELILQSRQQDLALGSGARAEARRITELARVYENRGEVKRQSLLTAMQTTKTDVMRLPSFEVRRAKSPWKMDFEEGTLHLDPRYKVVPQPEEGEDALAFYKGIVEMSAGPNRELLEGLFLGLLAMYEKKLQDASYYTAAVKAHGKKPHDELAIILANKDMPAGVTMSRGEHLRIK